MRHQPLLDITRCNHQWCHLRGQAQLLAATAVAAATATSGADMGCMIRTQTPPPPRLDPGAAAGEHPQVDRSGGG